MRAREPLGFRMDIRAFRAEDESAVIALCERCGLIRPWNDPRKHIARKRAVQPELFLVRRWVTSETTS
jgi:hypothetical protein